MKEFSSDQKTEMLFASAGETYADNAFDQLVHACEQNKSLYFSDFKTYSKKYAKLNIKEQKKVVNELFRAEIIDLDPKGTKRILSLIY